MLPLLDQLTVEKVKDGDQDLFERDFGKGKSCCREQVFYQTSSRDTFRTVTRMICWLAAVSCFFTSLFTVVVMAEGNV